MREKFARFMAGRYGMDSLGRFTMALTLIFIIMNYFTRNRMVPLLAWAGIILTYYRMFSRNTYKRSAENQRFLHHTAKLRHWFYKCPSCKQKIRIPKGKGRVEIRCPKCSATFIKKS